MGDFRARDADRDRAVEVIETAYVDGQLGDADRELRVARALSAATLGELEGLTRDLQVPAAPAPPLQRAARRRGGLAVAGGVAAAAGVLALVPFVFLASSSDQSAPPPGSESARAVEVPAVAEPAAAFEMAPEQVRRFLQAYERKFGTREAFEVSFFPDRAQAQVPVRGARPRMERWTWNGRWRRDTEASAVAGPLRLVDVGSIDVRRLFANIATARRTLEVDGGRFTHARLVRWDTDPVELNIYISNDLKETGYLSTTPSGQVRHSQPYEA